MWTQLEPAAVPEGIFFNVTQSKVSTGANIWKLIHFLNSFGQPFILLFYYVHLNFAPSCFSPRTCRKRAWRCVSAVWACAGC